MLLSSLSETRLCYKVRTSRSLRGTKANLGSVISSDGELIDDKDIVDTDIGAVLLLAPRYLLLKTTYLSTLVLSHITCI